MSETAGRRTYYLAAVAIVAIVLISAIAVVRPPVIQSVQPSETKKTMQVNGMGTVSAPPDEAILLLAVQTQASTATEATSDNAALMTKVIDALVGIGISKDSMSTVSYSLTPIYETKPEQTPAKIVGYAARNAIQVTVADFSLVGKALDTAITAGVNEVQGIMFTLSDTKLASLQDQALQLAIQDADGRAKAIASTLGVKIVGPISVTPSYSFQPTVQKLSEAAAQTPIQPGTLQVTATAQVTYEFA